MNSYLQHISFIYETSQGKQELLAGSQDDCFDFKVNEDRGTFTMHIFPTNAPVECLSCTLKIRFVGEIRRWRNHNYSWAPLDTDRIANEYSPKILQLSNAIFVQAAQTSGCWEANHKQKTILLWHLHTPGLKPVFYFKRHRNFYQPPYRISEPLALQLLFTEFPPVEWSRSPLPFSAIFCLTDHCDFDSVHLLEHQRLLLAECGVTISKGFFLNHYSKRHWNVSYETKEGADELKLWQGDGHELFYHSLSQSIKKEQDSQTDFEVFHTPEDIQPVTTWVDHGYQPYNFTMQSGEPAQREWIEKMNNKGMHLFWNYYDTFEDAGTINQIAVEQFCPSFVWSLKTSLPEKLRLLLYYYSEEKNVYAYRQWAGAIKSVIGNLFSKKIWHLNKETFGIIPIIIRQIFQWIFYSRSRNAQAKFAPLIFSYPGVPNAHIFQTLAIKNFNEAFSEPLLSDFIHNSGVCIAHTYLASSEKHHSGRVFSNDKGEISEQMRQAWHRLGTLIAEKKIWNPTISKLNAHFTNHSKVIFSLDEQGMIQYAGTIDIPIRIVDE